MVRGGQKSCALGLLCLGEWLLASATLFGQVPTEKPKTASEPEAVAVATDEASASEVAQAPDAPPGPASPNAPRVTDTIIEAAPSETFSPPSNERPYDPFLDGYEFGPPVVEGYDAPSAVSGTIVNLPSGDFPGTVNVIPRDVIRDQQILHFSEAVRDMGGATVSADPYFADRILLRGFELQSRDYRKDGFLDPTYVPRDFQNIERIEVLKGPTSVLYGAGSPAGMVNLITKKPVNTRIADGNITIGSWEQQRYTFDVNSTALGDRGVNIRVNGAHEDVNGFQNFNFMSRTMIAPGIDIQLDEYTHLMWLGEYHQDHRRGYQGIPAVGGNSQFFPYSTYAGQPANDFIHYSEFRQTLMLVHELDDYWTAQVGGQSLFYWFPASVTQAQADPLGSLPPDYAQFRTDVPTQNEQSQSLIANLAGDIELLGMEHKVLAGMEYIYFNSESTYNFGLLGTPLGVPPFINPAIIDLSNPMYTNPPAGIPVGSADFGGYRQNRVGFYLQDFAELNERWKVLSGVRFDTMNLTFNRTLGDFSVFPPTFTTLNTDQNFNYTSPRVGVVYQPLETEDLAFYSNYTQSFVPPPGGAYANTAGLKPILGHAYEGGFKAQIYEDLAFSVAGFYGTQQNSDFNVQSVFLVQVGEVRSRGVEMNLVGQLTDRLSIVSNYTYVDSRVFDAVDPTFNNKRQRNIPYNTLNFWTRYNLVQNSVHTFGAAAGMVCLGNRPGDLQNSFFMPGYTRTDAGLFYNRGRAYASLYAENVFDTRYTASSLNTFQVFPGAPGNVRFNFGVTY